MAIPSELPLLLDAGTAREPDGDYPGRVSAYRKAGADAVCLPVGFEPVLFPEAASVREVTERASSLIRAAHESGSLPAGGRLEPTGLLVPPLGESNFEDICAVRRGQVSAFQQAGADFLLLDRQTSLADMRAAVLAARGTNLPVLACFEPDEDCGDDEAGKFLSALVTLQAMGAFSVGLCGVPGEKLLRLAEEGLACADIPLTLIADALPEMTPAQYAEAVRPFLEAGVRLIGCGRGTTPITLRALRDLMKKYGPPETAGGRGDKIAAVEREVFFLGDDLLFSEPLGCSSLLSDELIALESEEVSAALVRVESIADAEVLSEEGAMAKLPIAIFADSATILEAALRYFQGRLIIDSSSPIEREVLEPLAAKYGAIIY